jgi:guanine nucleotide-binding protein G(i) subunit alpha
MTQTDARIVLLGCGEAGKTTILKQVRWLYGGTKEKNIHNDASQRTIIVRNVRYNLVMCIRLLVEECAARGIDLGIDNGARAGRILAISDEDLMMKAWEDKYIGGSEALSRDIRSIWKDIKVKELLDKHYAEMSILENAKFFLDSTHRVFKEGYTANEEDCLRNYSPTSGVTHIDFRVDRKLFKLYDTGGQRTERRKWQQHLCSVLHRPHVVCFVVNLAEFNTKLIEDGNTNRLQESLNVFVKVCKDISMIQEDEFTTELVLILTKKDLFRSKFELEKCNLRDYFHDFDGRNQYDSALRYITQSFINIATEYNEKGPLTHVFVVNALEYTEVANMFERGLVPLALQVASHSSNPSVPSHLDEILGNMSVTPPSMPNNNHTTTNLENEKNKKGWTKLFQSQSEEIGPPQYNKRRESVTGDTTKSTIDSDESSKIRNLTIKDKYKVVKLIARGGQGSIYLVEKTGQLPSKQIYIMKRMELKNGHLLNQSFDEIKTLYVLNNHKNICNIVDFFMEIKKRAMTVVTVDKNTDNKKEDKRKNSDKDMEEEDHMYILAIVMEYCKGGDMRTYLNAKKKEKVVIQELIIVRWLQQIVDALAFVHSQGLIHRDLKPENIFFQDVQHECVMLGDFGLSVIIQDRLSNFFQSKNSEAAGSPIYSAPEQMQGIIYDFKVDIWALGCIILEIMTLETCDLKLLSEKQRQEKLGACNKLYSDELVEFVRQCINIDPDQRPSHEKLISLVENIENA